MKKRMERIEDRLFAPLADEDVKQAVVAATQHISLIETHDPNPDEYYDYG
jgi:hypothetical protein